MHTFGDRWLPLPYSNFCGERQTVVSSAHGLTTDKGRFNPIQADSVSSKFRDSEQTVTSSDSRSHEGYREFPQVTESFRNRLDESVRYCQFHGQTQIN